MILDDSESWHRPCDLMICSSRCSKYQLNWCKHFPDVLFIIIIIIIIINPLTVRVVGAPQMILQPVFSIFPCSPLTSGTCWTPGLFIPWCYLPTSSAVYLVFFPLPLCLARWFWPDLMNGKHDHTTTVCASLRWSGGLCVVQLPAGVLSDTRHLTDGGVRSVCSHSNVYIWAGMWLSC